MEGKMGERKRVEFSFAGREWGVGHHARRATRLTANNVSSNKCVETTAIKFPSSFNENAVNINARPVTVYHATHILGRRKDPP